jgi:hypothetical protein
LTWPTTFDARLLGWNRLREQVQSLPLEAALTAINTWWFEAPWRPYYLHWDDQPAWPDPWQLLSDDIYCDLARGLGILYTITLLDRADMAPADLILTGDGSNLVQVSKEKYILNWEADCIVNTSQAEIIKRQYQQHQIL